MSWSEQIPRATQSQSAHKPLGLYEKCRRFSRPQFQISWPPENAFSTTVHTRTHTRHLASSCCCTFPPLRRHPFQTLYRFLRTGRYGITFAVNGCEVHSDGDSSEGTRTRTKGWKGGGLRVTRGCQSIGCECDLYNLLDLVPRLSRFVSLSDGSTAMAETKSAISLYVCARVRVWQSFSISGRLGSTTTCFAGSFYQPWLFRFAPRELTDVRFCGSGAVVAGST